MTRLIAILAAVAAIAVVGGTYLFTRMGTDDQFAQCSGSAVAGGTGQIGGPFELVNGQGETMTDKDVITEPTLIYFGYTFCPDVCPFDVARNSDALDLLADNGISATGAFISIDPARDTPEVVGEYAQAMHEKMIGLTGSPEQVKAASQAYKTYYKAHPSDDDLYLVDHTTFTYLALPEHGVVDFFRREATPAQMAERVQCYVEHA
ncbi:SCO family protein [Pseudosulfitobacter koreensis]|uniref:SCO family protein n=1 Tax=Pseudosulfitobacter koreensis TaxID=2968472 RepID=A0ABT1YX43_9RHOB|nr:SCO family protein [Pseudosulfitobacter koreense]MCR8825444.1 SCO family protein [Pseudosulfitobacter koreense]